jgi:hypothetical protein
MNTSQKGSWQKLFFLLGLACVIGSVQAQTTFSLGPQVGLNVTTATYSHNGVSFYDLRTAPLSRLEAGLVATMGSGHFLLQPALLYSQKGFVLKGTLLPTASPSSRPIAAQVTSQLNYLTLPLNFVYAQKADGEGFRLFGGGYIGLLLGGKRKVRDEYANTNSFASIYESESPIKPGNNSTSITDFYAKRLDAGLQAGLGYQHRSALVQLTYSVGLTNPAVPSPPLPPESSPSYHNRALTISLAYLLHPPKAAKL